MIETHPGMEVRLDMHVPVLMLSHTFCDSCRWCQSCRTREERFLPPLAVSVSTSRGRGGAGAVSEAQVDAGTSRLNSSHPAGRFGGCFYCVHLSVGPQTWRCATPDSKWESVCPQVSLTSQEAIVSSAWPELTVCVSLLTLVYSCGRHPRG